VNWLRSTLTPDELVEIGLIRTVSFNSSYLTSIDTDVPIPTDWSGLTSNVISSPFNNPCAVETPASVEVLYLL